jgi:hypothetical protein
MPAVGGFARLRGKLGRLRGKLGERALQRKFALWLGWLVLIGVAAGTTLWAHYIWTRSAYQPMVSDVFSFATLVITFFAAVIALLAYQVSTGSPDLELEIMLFGGEEPKSHVLYYKTNDERWTVLSKWFKAGNDFSTGELGNDPEGWTKIAYIWINNKSKYPARNPAVVVRFGDVDKPTLGLCKSWQTADDLPWKDTASTSSGVFVVTTQWDGEYPIHGFSTRRLPNLPLATLFSSQTEQPVVFHIDLLADGYRQTEKITIHFTVEPVTAELQQAEHQ